MYLDSTRTGYYAGYTTVDLTYVSPWNVGSTYSMGFVMTTLEDA